MKRTGQLCQSLRGMYRLWAAGNGTMLLLGVFRVVDAVEEYGHFVQLTGFAARQSVRQTERQTDRFEQMPIAGPLYSVFCATCNQLLPAREGGGSCAEKGHRKKGL